MSAIEIEPIAVGISNRFQSYEVLIDGQVRGRVKCGETRIFEVPPGVHTVKLAADAHSAPPVKVVVGLGKTSLVCQTKSRRRFGLFSALVPSTHIVVREEVDAPVASEGMIIWRDPRGPQAMHPLEVLED